MFCESSTGPHGITVDINKAFPDGTNLTLFSATGLGFTSTGDSETSLSEIEANQKEKMKGR
jgi:hypothetical protein